MVTPPVEPIQPPKEKKIVKENTITTIPDIKIEPTKPTESIYQNSNFQGNGDVLRKGHSLHFKQDPTNTRVIKIEAILKFILGVTRLDAGFQVELICNNKVIKSITTNGNSIKQKGTEVHLLQNITIPKNEVNDFISKGFYIRARVLKGNSVMSPVYFVGISTKITIDKTREE